MFYRNAITLVLGFAVIQGTHAAPNMKEGLWEVTTTIDMPGMAAMQGMGPMQQTHRSCITRDQAVPAGEDMGECKMVDHQITDNRVSWAVECKGAGAAKGGGSVTYHDDTFDGEMSMSMSSGGETIQIKNKMQGRWIGACPKK